LAFGPKEYVQIDFNNIKRVKVKLTAIQILFVRRYEWKGEFCEYIMPNGYVELSQEFSLSLNPIKRDRLKKFFQSKGLIEHNKIKS
jgi:hypothetical protein